MRKIKEEIKKIKGEARKAKIKTKEAKKRAKRLKKERIKKGTSNDKVSTERLTNLIVGHKEAWGIISEDMINLKEEELNNYETKKTGKR